MDSGLVGVRRENEADDFERAHGAGLNREKK